MLLTPYSIRELQTIAAIVADAVAHHLDLQSLSVAITAELASRSTDLAVSTPRPADRRHPDNLTVCQVCGSPAVIVPLTKVDRTATATHAIQCQNRPATNQPWRDGMCGHTEYVVRSER
jgi:hypothetical protein